MVPQAGSGSITGYVDTEVKNLPNLHKGRGWSAHWVPSLPREDAVSAAWAWWHNVVQVGGIITIPVEGISLHRVGDSL
jgi:hypothetical protein